ncbi:hypothetical protein MRB53_038366 [Persea americana]|nr:hypothetical protein MRB53_038366 [Persea americana]
MVNGKPSNQKQVQKLARSYDIQVDNLCQFLPQDRVTEFSALRPVDLLVQTLRAAAPDQMTEWHERLKTLRKDERKKETDRTAAEEHLETMKNKQRSHEGEVGRMRERTALRERQEALQKLRPFAEYNVAKREYEEVGVKRNAAQADLRNLERQIEPNLAAVSEKQEYSEQVQTTLKKHGRLAERIEQEAANLLKKVEVAQGGIDNLQQEIESERQGSKKAKQSIPALQRDLQTLQQAIDTPPLAFNPVEINQQIREMGQRMRTLKEERDDISGQITALREQNQQQKQIVERCENDKQSLQSQVGRQTNKLERASKDSAMAWKWIQNNRDRFKDDVFGPPMVTCKVRNPQKADHVESVINRSELLAFTVTCQDDFRVLQQQLYKTMKLTDINIRSSIKPLDSFRPPCSPEELRQFGLESWLLDQIEGPDAVLAMLCDNRNIHRTGFTNRNLSPAQSEALERSSISSWVTAKDYNIVTRRREYGAAGNSSRVQRLKKAELLTDAPVDLHVEHDIDQRLREANIGLEQINTTFRELDAKRKELDEKHKGVKKEQETLEEEKRQKQRQQSEFNALPAKRDRLQTKLDEARGSIAEVRRLIMPKLEQGDRLCLEKAKHALDYARKLNALSAHHETIIEAEIVAAEALSDLEQLQARHVEEARLLETCRQEVTRLTQEKRAAKQRAQQLEAQCRAIFDSLTDLENEVRTETSSWEPTQVEAEIESIAAQLESLHGGNPNLIRDFERRARDIEKRTADLDAQDVSLKDLQAEIQEIQQQWEPELDRLVGRISDAFSENCSRIQCAGKWWCTRTKSSKNGPFTSRSNSGKSVRLACARLELTILIPCRERDELAILTSKRQSGGERTVSTIFYLMSLQSLARAPFRVVDEINQGMDPRNERLVHSRIVATACAEYSSQYFLITPKLLTGLDYHPKMKVHCIASGEHVPQDHSALDFGALAQKALDIKARHAATAMG